ncbi:MAG: PA2169 family four-helix-bundle protein [Bacteroidetes bacterium]|nr:PA2169 family four-helix-bundle protein [Bacteroidota bacterium]HET6244200.1 PA2169 family four-helix-bundle protein [Bacteroidia bacterium]
MKNQKEVQSDVNHILEVCNERIEGYMNAAKNVKDVELKSVFEKYAQQTKKFQQELLPFSDKSSPEEAGTRIIADTWRVWMDMKAALTDGGREAIVNASVTGEENAIKNYEDELDEEIPMDLRSILEKQLSEIKSAYNHIQTYSTKSKF